MRFYLRLAGLFCLLAASPAWAQALDLNQADQPALEHLPGIGPAKAKAILQYRAAHGPFASVEALDAVPGIGPKLMERLRPEVRIGPITEKPTVPSKPITAPVSKPARPAAIIRSQGRTRFFDAQGRPIKGPEKH